MAGPESEQEFDSPGDVPIWFGNLHRGKRLSEVPRSYREFCAHPDRQHCRWYEEFCALNQAYGDELQNNAPENPGLTKLWFGRHEGLPFCEVYDRYKSYVLWCINPRQSNQSWYPGVLDLYHRFMQWRADHRRPYRPRRRTELIRHVGDLTGPWDNKDAPSEDDEYSFEDGFVVPDSETEDEEFEQEDDEDEGEDADSLLDGEEEATMNEETSSTESSATSSDVDRDNASDEEEYQSAVEDDDPSPTSNDAVFSDNEMTASPRTPRKYRTVLSDDEDSDPESYDDTPIAVSHARRKGVEQEESDSDLSLKSFVARRKRRRGIKPSSGTPSRRKDLDDDSDSEVNEPATPPPVTPAKRRRRGAVTSINGRTHSSEPADSDEDYSPSPSKRRRIAGLVVQDSDSD